MRMLIEKNPSGLSLKSERDWTFSEALRLTPQAAANCVGEAERVKRYVEYRKSNLLVPVKFQPRPEVQIDFSLSYEDGFGHKENVKWRASEVFQVERMDLSVAPHILLGP